MRRPPRDPHAPILAAPDVATALVSALFCVAVFAVFFWAVARGEELQHAQTFAVNTMVALEIAYLFTVRLQHNPPFDFRSVRGTPALAIAIGAVVALQIGFTYAPPLQAVFGTRPVGAIDVVVSLLAAIALLLILEAEKAVRRKTYASA